MAEPRSGDKVDFDELLKTYYQTITASLAPSNKFTNINII